MAQIKLRRLIGILICTAIFAGVLQNIGVSAAAEDPEIRINGSRISLRREVVYENGGYLLPFKELMGKMGFYVAYDEDRAAYVGTVNGAEVSVAADSTVAVYDSVPVELEHPTVGLSDDVLVELRFIDMLYEVEGKVINGMLVFTAEILADETQEDVVDDVDEYLAGIEVKNYTIRPEQLSDAAISDPELIEMRMVEVDDAPGFTEAVEVDNLVDSPRLYYDAQITLRSSETTSAGDVMVLTFYARKIRCVDESGFAQFNSTFEARDADWTKFHNVTEQISEEWTRFQYAFTARKDTAAGAAQLGFRIGFRLQTIQFGGVQLANYGKRADIERIDPEKAVQTTYYGREEGALWREEALRRIEKYRKNDMTILVRDEEGDPILNAKVTANMTKSEFLWGTAVNNETRVFSSGNTSIINQDIIKNEFNSIVLESNTKMNAFKMRENALAVNFARANDLYFRAHAVLWDALRYFPEEDINEDSTEQEVLAYCLEHASRILSTFNGSVSEMDVVNEPLNNDYFRLKYGDAFIAELYKTVHDMAPDVKLFLNETGITGNDTNWASAERLKTIIESLLAQGAPLQGLGIQNHSAGFIYPQTFYNQLDYIAENLDYIAITEYDYISNLSDNVEAESVEADFLRDSIILAYSHPKMTGFTMWGFGDIGHWRANAPLYYRNYAAKPALDEWNKYVWGEWFTQETAETDENGMAVIRGHRGEYDITVTVGDTEAKTTLVLTRDGANTVTAVLGSGLRLASSQEVEEALPEIPVLRAVYGEDNAKQEYKKMYENKAGSAQKSGGTDVSFLLDEGKASVCTLTAADRITVKLDEEMESGWVTLRTAGENQGQFRICSVNAGEIKQLYAGETQNGKLSVYFDGGADEIRIEGLVGASSALKEIKVSEKEDRSV